MSRWIAKFPLFSLVNHIIKSKSNPNLFLEKIISYLFQNAKPIDLLIIKSVFAWVDDIVISFVYYYISPIFQKILSNKMTFMLH